MKYNLFFLTITMFLLIGIACKDDEVVVADTDPKNNLAAMPYQTLSEYEFFSGNLADHQPAEGVLPYDLNTPLFTNYAKKLRFIWMPEGQSTNYNGDTYLDFPVGTIIIKTFYYDNDFLDPAKGQNIIETRLLIHRDTGWMAAPYLWRAGQTEADHHFIGKQLEVSWKHTDGQQKTINYSVPNEVECFGCHNINNNLIPIGPKARNLNRDFEYADGTKNQIEKMVEMGYLQNAPALNQIPAIPIFVNNNSGTLEERARGYLDVNCGHCHNPEGPAKNSVLNLYFDEEDPYSLGICKPPLASGQGSGDFAYDIIPGQPDSSIMVYRMNSIELDVAMPELGRSIIHEEGVQLIREWIAGMDGDGCN